MTVRWSARLRARLPGVMYDAARLRNCARLNLAIRLNSGRQRQYWRGKEQRQIFLAPPGPIRAFLDQVASRVYLMRGRRNRVPGRVLRPDWLWQTTNQARARDLPAQLSRPHKPGLRRPFLHPHLEQYVIRTAGIASGQNQRLSKQRLKRPGR